MIHEIQYNFVVIKILVLLSKLIYRCFSHQKASVKLYQKLLETEAIWFIFYSPCTLPTFLVLFLTANFSTFSPSEKQSSFTRFCPGLLVSFLYLSNCAGGMPQRWGDVSTRGTVLQKPISKDPERLQRGMIFWVKHSINTSDWCS